MGNLIWTRTIGGSKVDFGCNITKTKDGGCAIAGFTSSFGAGGYDYYVVKLKSNGDLDWTKTIGGRFNDEAGYISTTKDGGYILTGFTNSWADTNGDIYIVKLDSNGNLQWTQTAGGKQQDWGGSIIQSKTKGYIDAGFTRSFSRTSNAQSFIVLLDSLGNSSCPDSTGGILSNGGIIDSGGVEGNGGGTIDSGGTIRSGGKITLVCGPTGLNGIKKSNPEITLYPNPCIKGLYINLSSMPSVLNTKVLINIYDITGRVLLSTDFQIISNEYPIDISELESGMYLIKIITNQNTQTLKFIKE
jgi:hypothetical protein